MPKMRKKKRNADTATSSADSEMFPITIKTLVGKTLKLNVRSSETILEVKKKLEAEGGFRVREQRLIFTGRQLEDDCELKDYKISKDSTLHLVVRMVNRNDDDDDDDNDEEVEEQEPSIPYKLSLEAHERYVDPSKRRNMSRLEIVKELFNSFVNRSISYNYPTQIGLILFSE